MSSLPTATDVHVNSLLTGMSVGFMNEMESFVASRAFAALPVTKQSDNYTVFDRGDLLRDEAREKAPGAKGNRSGYRVDNTPTYNAKVYSLDKPVPDEVRANADPSFDPDAEAVMWLTQKRLLKEEVDWVSAFFTTGLWSADVTPSPSWDDQASDIIADIDAESERIEGDTGTHPNTLVVNRIVWNAIKNHADIVDRVKHTSSGPVTAEIVARLLGLERVLIASAARNTAEEGATADVSYIAGNNALLCYTAPNPGIMTPTAGVTFRWTPIDGGAGGAGVTTFRDDDAESDIHRIKFAFAHELTASVLGVFFSSAAS